MSESLNFLDPSVLAGLDNLELRARVVVEGFLSGSIKALIVDLVLNLMIIVITSEVMICGM